MSDKQSMIDDIKDQLESILEVMQKDVIDKYFEDEGKDSEGSKALSQELENYEERLKEVHQAYSDIYDIVWELKRS